MAFFFLNKIDKSISKNDLDKEFRKFGKLKFIGDFKTDNKENRFNSTIAVFHEVHKISELESYCKSIKVLLKEKVGNDTSQTKPSKEITPKQPLEPKSLSSSTIANPSFHFYKDKAYGKGIENFTLTNNFKDFFEIPNAQTFALTTIYPGLLVGSGYNHPKLKESNEDFQLGFFFDHTTGLPIISGSSIKGLLKSVCEKQDFMLDVYGKTVDLNIFEDGKTIFYDAFILSTENEQNKIFGSDYITSHFSNEENGMFKEPNPVKFLKVLPDVTFKFQFKAPDEAIDIFKKIILDFGLGAKTNVGYGKFQEVK